MSKARTVTTGAGLGLGMILAAPAAAQADDIAVTNLNDTGSGSLREAVAEANLDSDLDRILFDSKLSGTIDLAVSQLLVFYPAEIIGPGARRVSIGADDTEAVLINSSAAGSTISGLTFAGSHNTGGEDGGAIVSFGDLTLLNSTVSGNRSDGGGGGIYATFGSDLVIRDSTISGNTGGTGGNDYGGGILVQDGADLSLINSTVSGNSAGEDGGGVYIAESDSEIRNSTITGNTAETDAAGGIYASGSELSVRGTIVANNTADSTDYTDLQLVTDTSYSFSFSLVEDPDNHTISGSTNLLGVDPALKPLKDNGGPTDTHAFKKSPAKNAGPSDAPDKDQRGAPRKGKADIGAYELTKCKGVIVNFVGTSGKDKLKGTKKKDGMLGLGGNDKLKGKKGKDGLCGGRGKDKLIGGPGKDKFNGGPGKDKEIQ